MSKIAMRTYKKRARVKPLPKPIESQLKTSAFDIWRPARGIDEDLLRFTGLNPDDKFLINFTFEANDVEFYDVQSVTDRATCITLLQVGIRTAGEAIELLRAINLNHLIEDNSRLTTKLYRQKVSSQIFSMFLNEFSIVDKEYSNIVDAISIYKFKGFREADSYYTLPERVLDGEFNVNDLKAIGWRHLSNKQDHAFLYAALTGLKKGTSEITAREIRDMLDLRAAESGTVPTDEEDLEDDMESTLSNVA